MTARGSEGSVFWRLSILKKQEKQGKQSMTAVLPPRGDKRQRRLKTAGFVWDRNEKTQSAEALLAPESTV